MIEYLTVTINPPPLDEKILVKKSQCAFDDGARVIILGSKEASLNWHIEELVSTGYTLWAKV